MGSKKILSFALGPIVGALLSFITLPLISWYFSPVDVGRNAVLQTTINFSVLFFVLGLDQAYVREYHERPDKAALFKVCILPGLLLLVLASISFSFFSPVISQFLFGEANDSWFWGTLLCVLASFLIRFLSLILRMQERGLAYSASQVIPKILLVFVLLSYIALEVKASYTSLIAATSASVTCVALVYLWNTRREWTPSLFKKVDKSDLVKLLKFGFPLIGAGVAYWALKATSIVALRASSSFEELAVYSMAMSFAAAATIFQNVFSTLWMPAVYKRVAANESLEQIDVAGQQVLAVVCVLLALAGSFAWLTDFILPKDYVEVKYLVVACMIQPLLYTLSEVGAVGINVQRRTGYSLLVVLIAFAANAALSYMLTPAFGAVGAAVANAIAYVVFLVMRTEVSSLVWRPVARSRMYVAVFVYVSLALVTAAFGHLAGWFSFAGWFILFLITLVVFRTELRGVKMLFSRRARP